jgi:hypothetical protein
VQPIHPLRKAVDPPHVRRPGVRPAAHEHDVGIVVDVPSAAPRPWPPT